MGAAFTCAEQARIDSSSSNFERDKFRGFRDICWHDRERCRHRHHDPSHTCIQTLIPTTTRIRRAHAARNRRSPPLLGSSRPSTYAGGGSAIKAPKDVDLKAKPKKVDEKEKTTLTASLLPCSGTQGEPIEFEKKTDKGWKGIGGKTADANCRGKISPKVKATTRYRALSGETNNFQAGASATVRVKVRD